MEKCKKCSRGAKSVYHADGKCPNKTLSMEIPEFMTMDSMIAKKFGGAVVGIDPARGSDSTSVDIIEVPPDEPDQ